MRARLLKFGLFAGGFAVLAVVVKRQHDTTAALREKAQRLHAASLEQTRLREENAALQAQAVSADELAKLRTDQAEASRLRTEAAALREKLQPTPQPKTIAGAAAPTLIPTIERWANTGQATPDATFQTGVWATLQGETDALAKVIAFDAEGRALIEAQFARLPEKDRVLYGSPEKIFATLLAARLPQDITFATVTQRADGEASAVLRMRIQRANGSSKDSNFNFVRSAGDDSWRILVPTSVVKNYQRMLSDSPVVPTQ